MSRVVSPGRKLEMVNRYVETSIDLYNHLIKNPATTFFARVTTGSILDLNIHNDDLLIVDSGAVPADGDAVVVEVDGELLVRRFQARKLRLVSEGRAHEAGEVEGFTVLGVVQHVIHSLTKGVNAWNR